MRKLLKKKVNVFGKAVPVFVIAILAMGLVSAALITSWGVITGLVTVSQGFSLDGQPYESIIPEEPVTMYSLEAKTIISDPHYLENLANVDAEFSLATTCTYQKEGGSIVDCDEDVVPTVEYLLNSALIPFHATDWYTTLTTEFEAGMEVVTVILPVGTTLASLGDISFTESEVTGYPVSVNILLDIDGDGVFESRKDLRTGDLVSGNEDDVLKIESNYNGGIPGAWTSVNSITSGTNAWLYSAQPGATGLVINTLTQWIAGASNHGSCYETTLQWDSYPCSVSVTGNTKVYGIQIESLGWIEASSSVVSDIVIGGIDYEISGLPAGERTDFQIVTDFPKMLIPGEYTITTTVDNEIAL